MKLRNFYPLALIVLLSSCFGPNFNDVSDLADKKRDYDRLMKEYDNYRFSNTNNFLVTRKENDSWTNLQKQDRMFKTQKKIDELNSEIIALESKYESKYSKAKIEELQKAVWACQQYNNY